MPPLQQDSHVPLMQPLEHRVHLSASAAPGLVHTTAELSVARSAIGATVVGNLSIFAGGGGRVGPSRAVDIYNNVTGQWSTAKLSKARAGVAAATVGNFALFAGGAGFGSTASSVVDIYNAATGKWSKASLSNPDYRPIVAVVDGKVLFGGGGDGSVVDIFDSNAGQWSTSHLTKARSQITVTTVGNDAVFAGGATVGRITPGGVAFQGDDTVDIYNAVTGIWSSAALSQGRFDIATATVGNLAIFAGGNAGSATLVNGGVSTAAIDTYNSETGQWSVATLSLPRETIAAAAVAGKGIFAGGFAYNIGDDAAATQTADIYGAQTGQWSAVSLPEPLGGAAVGTVGPKTVFAGSTAVDIYDAATGDWSASTLSQGRFDVAATSAGSTAVFAGGIRDAAGSGGVSAVADLFTVPSLTGSIAPARRGRVQATLDNTGSSAFPGSHSVAIYASTGDTIDSGAVLLGSVRVRSPLAAGASEDVSVPVAIPTDLPAGRYHLVAAAGPPHQLTAFASQRRTFTITQPAVPAQRAANALPPACVFSTRRFSGDSIVEHLDEVLA